MKKNFKLTIVKKGYWTRTHHLTGKEVKLLLGILTCTLNKRKEK